MNSNSLFLVVKTKDSQVSAGPSRASTWGGPALERELEATPGRQLPGAGRSLGSPPSSACLPWDGTLGELSLWSWLPGDWSPGIQDPGDSECGALCLLAQASSSFPWPLPTAPANTQIYHDLLTPSSIPPPQALAHTLCFQPPFPPSRQCAPSPLLPPTSGRTCGRRQ